MIMHKNMTTLVLIAWSILLGTASGDFPVQVPSSGGGTGVQTGDFNNDGRDDLVLYSGGKISLTVQLSAGDGSFHESGILGGAQGTLTSGAAVLDRSPVISDEDGDGDLDVVAWSFKRTSKVWYIRGTEPNSRIAICDYKYWRNVWLGRGDGTFAPLVVSHQGEVEGGNVPEEDFSKPGVSGDFDLDGDSDFAVFSSDRKGDYVGPVQVHLRIGENVPSDLRMIDVAGSTFNTMGRGDFNGDGQIDLILVGQNSSIALMNDGDW